jgi:hypothetical protein
MVISLMSVAANIFLIVILTALMVVIFHLSNSKSSTVGLQPDIEMKKKVHAKPKQPTSVEESNADELYGVVGEHSNNSSQRNTNVIVDVIYTDMNGKIKQ